MALQMDNIFGQSEDNLKDRWQQSGSTLVNASSATGGTIHTVSTGKKFYLSSISFYSRSTNDNNITLEDDSTIVTYFVADIPDVNYTINFTTPLLFETSVVSDSDGQIAITITGWEE